MENFDVAVIGAGPGGYPAAIRAAQLGARVALIEKEQIGGTCLNWGCIPTKTVIASATLVSQIEDATRGGLCSGKVSADFGAIMSNKKSVVERLQSGVKHLLKANGVVVYAGTASFETRNVIAISGGDTAKIEAAKTILATGSASIVPGFLPKHPLVVDSRGFLDLEELPKSLLVLGGGYIGCELACMAAQLGSKVTVVELLDDILLRLDPDLRAVVRKHMEERLGIRILTGKPMKDAKATPKTVCATVGETTLKASCLLAAVGRRPVSEGLALSNAGVKTTEKGFIQIDEYGRTTAPGVYAVGDVAGGTQLAHAATSQGIIAAGNACLKSPRKYDTLVPAVIFTAPEAATVGMSEQEARAGTVPVKIGKFPYSALGRALAAGEPEGFVKWIADAETGRLLGAGVVGAHATDLIAEAALAIRNELTTREVGHTIHAHPTFPELWMEAAHAADGEPIHSAPPRKTK